MYSRFQTTTLEKNKDNNPSFHPGVMCYKCFILNERQMGNYIQIPKILKTLHDEQ